jgi:hypothetical protein
MDIKAVSFNVRGLAVPSAQTRLRQYLASVSYNVLFMQEHKLRQADWSFLGKRIWPRGEFFVASAEDRLHALRNDAVIVGRGGLATAVSHELQPFVTFDLVSPCQRAIILHLDGLPSGPLGLLNVYGPNEPRDRAALWESLANLVDPSRPWLVGGDFNMSLLGSDQLGGLPSDLVGVELDAWSMLSTLLGLTEYLLAPNASIRYTWDNHRLGVEGEATQARIFKRLDRFYCSSSLLALCPHAVTEI